MEIFYRRHLPHYQLPGATYFVTFRLAGSLPAEVVKELLNKWVEQFMNTPSIRSKERACNKRRNRHQVHFDRGDSVLSSASSGPRWLQRADIAKIVQDAIMFRDGIKYNLYASSIMPNHVHIVFQLLDGNGGDIKPATRNGNGSQNRDLAYYPVTEILGSLKKHTALEANKILRRRGAFWMDESYDHVVRDGGELERILWYVLFNPQKAGLVKSWKDWRWTYCKPGLLPL